MKSFAIACFVLAAFLFIGYGFSRKHSHSHFSSSHKCNKDELKMSANLIPYFDQFIEDCKRHNINYDHIYCLDYLHFEHSHSVQGVTDFYDKDIAINTHLEKDTIGMRFVVYHEIGHWMGLEHGKGIMQKSYSTENDMEWAKENWDELTENFFNKLK